MDRNESGNFNLDDLAQGADYEEFNPDTQNNNEGDGFLKQLDVTKNESPKNNNVVKDNFDDMDLLDLNEEEIDNFKVRVFILMNPDDDNHKNININNLFMI